MVGPAAREQESLLVGFLALQSMDTFLQVFFSRTCVPPGVGQTSIHSIRAFDRGGAFCRIMPFQCST